MNSALADCPIVVSSLFDRLSVSIMFRATPTSDFCRWYLKMKFHHEQHAQRLQDRLTEAVEQ